MPSHQRCAFPKTFKNIFVDTDTMQKSIYRCRRWDWTKGAETAIQCTWSPLKLVRRNTFSGEMEGKIYGHDQLVR